ncbi:MAG: ABC transporter permease [Acetivibrionales bacterium]|jgi:sodium transport system permease protein
MNLRYVWIVFKKELKDIIRDRRTIVTSILLPMLLIPLINIIMGGGVQKFQRDINENVTIALSASSNTAEIKRLVQEKIIPANPNLKLVETDDPVDALNKGQVRCIINFDEDYEEKLGKGIPFKITLQYDESRTKSQAGADFVADAIRSFESGIVAERIAAAGIDEELLNPVEIERVNIAANQQKGSNMVLQMLLPLLVGMLVSVGGIPAATDLVAGEKERKTLEPLLTTLPSRGSLLLGKYLTVTVFSIVSVIAIMTGIAIGYLINPNSLTMGVESQLYGLNIQPLALVLAVLITILLGMTFSGIQIAISAFARSYKEAQTYLSFLMLVAMIPGYATMFLQPGDLTVVMFLLPVMNTIASFKMLLGGMVNYGYLFVSLAASLVFVALTLWLAASLFGKEKIIFRI